MADELKFTEEGLKIYGSIAGKMEELMAAGGTIAVAAPGVGTIIGAAVFVVGLIKALTDDDKVYEALRQLQSQIDEIKKAVVELEKALTELTAIVGEDFYRQNLTTLSDYWDDLKVLADRLVASPNDVENAVQVANEAGVLCDKFLRRDFEIWRWRDVIEKAYGDRTRLALSSPHFKNLPTLPVYVMGILVWLKAREKAIAAGQKHRLIDDQSRLANHQSATSVRARFDKYFGASNASQEDREEFGIPRTITENIQFRIRGLPVASDRYPVNGICRYYWVVGSLMTGKSRIGSDFDITMRPGSELCTIPAYGFVGPSELEVEMETEAGVATLGELNQLLGRVAAGGSLKLLPNWQFPNNESFPPATLYFVDQNGHLQWYRNESSSRRGGSTVWKGPLKIGDNQWNDFPSVLISGGGHSIYGMKPNGDLFWFAHDGFADGTNRLRGPKPVGDGWNGFKSVFSIGEYVIYGIHPDGRLIWFRHKGAINGDGEESWMSKVVDSDWQDYEKVFSGGGGVIYRIRSDGVLERRIHKTYLTGEPQWEPREEIGTKWNVFRDVVAAADGVIYAFTQDNQVLWYRYAKRRPPPPIPNTAPNPVEQRIGNVPKRQERGGGLADRIDQLPDYPEPDSGVAARVGQLQNYSEREVWEGPIPIIQGFAAYRSVFALMQSPNPIIR